MTRLTTTLHAPAAPAAPTTCIIYTSMSAQVAPYAAVKYSSDWFANAFTDCSRFLRALSTRGPRFLKRNLSYVANQRRLRKGSRTKIKLVVPGKENRVAIAIVSRKLLLGDDEDRVETKELAFPYGPHIITLLTDRTTVAQEDGWSVSFVSENSTTTTTTKRTRSNPNVVNPDEIQMEYQLLGSLLDAQEPTMTMTLSRNVINASQPNNTTPYVLKGKLSSKRVAPIQVSDLLLPHDQNVCEGRLRTFLLSQIPTEFKAVEWRFPFSKSLVRIQRSDEPRCPFCRGGFETYWQLLIHFGLTHLAVFDADFLMEMNGLVVVQIVATVFEENIPVPEFNLRPRRYMHSGTMETLLPMDLSQDSDDDVDESWLHERGEVLLNEYEDVAPAEKALCLKWNRFVVKRDGITSDSDAESAAKEFVKQCKDENIPRELLVACMISMWESSLVNSLIELFRD